MACGFARCAGPKIEHRYPMSERPAEFFNAWSLYDQILDHNLMFHDEIFEDVRAILVERFGDALFAVLDLGCGSARHVSSTLRGLNVSRYVGYDLSEVALEHARRNLDHLKCPVELKVGNLLEALDDPRSRYDVILSSFAFHHLSPDEKRRFFRGAADRLNPGGMLLLVDSFREDDEDRPTFLERYTRWIRSDWRALADEALDAIIAHVRAHDFPETRSAIEEFASDAGLMPSGEGGRFGWHRTLGFERGGSANNFCNR